MDPMQMLEQLMQGRTQEDPRNQSDMRLQALENYRKDKFGQPYQVTPFQGNPPQQQGRFAGQRGSPDLPDATDVRIMQRVPTDSVQEDFADKFGTEAFDRTNRNSQGIRNPGYVPTPRPNPLREEENDPNAYFDLGKDYEGDVDKELTGEAMRQDMRRPSYTTGKGQPSPDAEYDDDDLLSQLAARLNR